MRRFSLAMLAWLATGAFAQAPTQVIVPFPPGGLDALARIVAQGVAEQAKERRRGKPRRRERVDRREARWQAGRKIWLFADASTMTVNPNLYPKDPAFDAQRDLRAVMAIGFMPSILTVHPGLGPKTLKEFVELARTQEVPYVSGGIGATGHLSMEYFSGAAGGLKLRHVPCKGAPRR